MKIVHSCGAGVQSSTMLLMAIRDILPRPDHVVFADTQAEPAAVYDHLAWLREQAADAGIPFAVVTTGDIYQEALDFAQNRASPGRKRFASLPYFIKNTDGSQGIQKRQCTSEYKIEPIEGFLRQSILGLAPRQKAPQEPVIEHWFGISSDETRRCRHPGEYRKKQIEEGVDMFGLPILRDEQTWYPCSWKVHCYPLAGRRLFNDRREETTPYFPPMTRQDCIAWLEHYYPNHPVPRSACVMCPYRSSAEWRFMRDTSPEDWARAVDFDKAVRERPALGQVQRKLLVGTPYLHRDMVPLDMVDLSEDTSPSLSVAECEGMCGN